MKKNKLAFTLVELMVAITISFMLMVMSYANYSYFQNITKVKITLKEISQGINEARNLAISGLNKASSSTTVSSLTTASSSTIKKNQDIGILFEKDSEKVIFYSYDFNYKDNLLKNDYILKEKNLQDGVKIKNIILGTSDIKDKVMLYFSSIDAKPIIYTFDASGNKSEISTGDLNIKISFKEADSGPLVRELKYIKSTNVVDY